METRCGWVKFMVCGAILYGKRFPLWLKGFVSKSYIRSAILHGNKAWCL